MKLYVVRIRLKHEPVGIYWVHDVAELGEAIATITNPGICEYLEITEPGALTWRDPEPWRLGVSDGPIHEETVVGTATFVSYRRLENHLDEVKAGIGFEGSLEDLVINHVHGWKRYEPSWTASMSDASLLQTWADEQAAIEANDSRGRKLGAPPSKART